VELQEVGHRSHFGALVLAGGEPGKKTPAEAGVK